MMTDSKRLDLVSPFGGEKASYTWPLQHHDKNSKMDGSIEIIETIRWVFEDLPELREAMREELSVFTISGDMKDYQSMKTLCDKYNSSLVKVLEARGPQNTPLPGKRPSVALLKHIIQKSYNQAVSDPEKLNEYKSWSPEVYGETSFEFISQMLDNCNLKPDDVFLDLGSGVGQVVLQVAASCSGGLAKCIGIEKADVPYQYSKELDYHFKFWMKWFGKSCSEYKLIKGDFFAEEFRSLISSASFIFVNNFAFGPRIDHALKKRFEDLKDGSRIVSSKCFSPLNFRISDRNLNDIGTMIDVRELQPIKESVSWTHNSVSYYCHTINRKKLEEYFTLKQSRSKNNSDTESISLHLNSHRASHHRKRISGHSSSSSSASTSSVSSLSLNNHECTIQSGTAANSLLIHRRSSSVRDSNSDSNSNDSTSINTANDPHNTITNHSIHIQSLTNGSLISPPLTNSDNNSITSSGGKTSGKKVASGKSPGAMSGKKAPTTYDQDGQIIFGPTTRKAWKEFVESTATPTTTGQGSGGGDKKKDKVTKKKTSTPISAKSPAAVSKKKLPTSAKKSSKPKEKKVRESDDEDEEEEDENSSSASSSTASSASESSENESESSSESGEEDEASSSNENVDENIKKASSAKITRKNSVDSKAKSSPADKKSPESKRLSGDSTIKKAGRGRPRKYAPGVSAVVKRAASTAAGKKTKSPTTKLKVTDASGLPVRPRGRPPKSPRKISNDHHSQENSLDVFHQQTLKTISSTMGKRTSPAPGTFEDTIDTSLNDPSYLSHLPSAIIKDSSLLSMEDVLDQLQRQQKRQLSSFVAYMQTPEYRIQLSKEIEEEKKRNQLLKLQVNSVENTIRSLQSAGVESLKSKLNEVGISNVTTPQEVLLKAGEIIARNKMLLEQELTLTAQLKQQEALNQQIEAIRSQLEVQNGGSKKGTKGKNDSKSSGPSAVGGRGGKGSKRQSTSSNSSAASSTSVDTSSTPGSGFGTPGLPQSSMANLDKVSGGSFFGSWSRPPGTPSPVTFSSLSSSVNSNNSGMKGSAPSGIFGSGFGSSTLQSTTTTVNSSKNQGSKGLTTPSGTTITPIVISTTGGSSTGTSSISNAKDHINSMIIAQLNTGVPPNGPSGGLSGTTSSFSGQQHNNSMMPNAPAAPTTAKAEKGKAKEPKVKKEPKKRGPKPKDAKTHLVPKEKLHELLAQQPAVKPDSPKVPLPFRTRKASAASAVEPSINYGTGPNTIVHNTNDHLHMKPIPENKAISKMLKDEKNSYSSPKQESSPRNSGSSTVTSTSIKSSPHPAGDSNTTETGPGGEVKERLTLTLVLNRKNDSASVKSSSKSASNNTSPEKSPVKSPEYSIGSVGSVGATGGCSQDDREQGTLRSGTKRKGVICSPERSTGTKKTRSKSNSNLVIDESSQSPASTTSSGGEKKITIKFGTSTSRTESSLITSDPTLTTAPSTNVTLNNNGSGHQIGNGPTHSNVPGHGSSAPSSSTSNHPYNSNNVNTATNQTNTASSSLSAASSSAHHPHLSSSSTTASTNAPTTKSIGSYRKWKKEMDNSFDKSLANASHASNDSQSSTNSSSQLGTGGSMATSTTNHPAVPGSSGGVINNSDGHSTTSSTRPNSGSSIESLLSMDSNSGPVTDPLDNVSASNNNSSSTNSNNSSRDNVVNVNKYQLNYATVDEMRRQQQYQPNRHQQPPPPTIYGSQEDVYQQFFNSAAARASGASRDARTGLPGAPYGLFPGMWPPNAAGPPGSGQPPYIRNVPMFPWKG